MRPLSIILTSILIACETKDTDTSGTDDTGTPTTTTPPVTHEISTCEGTGEWCQNVESSFSVSEENFSAALAIDGTLSAEGCQSICEAEVANAESWIDYLCTCSYEGLAPDNTHTVVCNYYNDCMVEGRAHAGIERVFESFGPTTTAAWLAKAAHSEATSALAFTYLAKELRAHAAPQEIIQQCYDAAKDEIRHARLLGFLASQAGSEIPKVESVALSQRSLYEIALENVIEGCVNETYAALQALYQARNATDKGIQTIFGIIARDETRHAELARIIHAWIMPQLTQEEQRSVLNAQKEAFRSLKKSIHKQTHISSSSLGMPSYDTSRVLLQEMERALALAV